MRNRLLVLIVLLVLMAVVILIACVPPPNITATYQAQAKTPVVTEPLTYVDREHSVVCYMWGSSLFCLKY